MAHLSTAQRRVTIIRYRCAYSARSDVHTQHAAHICGHKYLFVCAHQRVRAFSCAHLHVKCVRPCRLLGLSLTLSLVLSVRLSVCRWHWRGTPKCSRVYAFVCVNDLSLGTPFAYNHMQCLLLSLGAVAPVRAYVFKVYSYTTHSSERDVRCGRTHARSHALVMPTQTFITSLCAN